MKCRARASSAKTAGVMDGIGVGCRLRFMAVKETSERVSVRVMLMSAEVRNAGLCLA